jgi:hypothetical protein
MISHRAPTFLSATLGLLLLAFASPHPVAEETPTEKGRRIAEEARDSGDGFGSLASQGEMILRDRSGGTSTRRFRSSALEGAHSDQGKTLLVFEFPPDIAGTGLLTHSKVGTDDSQWIFLPALKRVKRISSGNQTGSFVGSEFSYEDMRAPVLEDYNYLWSRDEACPGAEEINCWVIERKPKDPDSGYSRIVTWIGQEEYRHWQSEFFDRKGAELKTLSVGDYKRYKGRFWRAGRMEMVNHQNGKSTELIWTLHEFGVPLDDADFTTRALELVRP